MYTQYVIMIWT